MSSWKRGIFSRKEIDEEKLIRIYRWIKCVVQRYYIECNQPKGTGKCDGQHTSEQGGFLCLTEEKVWS